ncbi:MULTISPECIES: hypothetical protein [unclassified Streptomyces]|uniref:hypothetical protein n=1 Tax=unclassified Streptomyces TaxID=2593676 RepID=UPI003794E940
MGTTGQGQGQGRPDADEATEQESAAPARRSAVGEVLAALGAMAISGVTGAALAALVVGLILKDAPVYGTGGVVLAALIVVAALGSRRGEPEEPPAGRIALARIEDLRATSGEMADVPVEFRLTVAPEGRSAYRVKISQQINLVDIPSYRPRGIAVVEYHPEKPWDVRIITRPTPEWSRRAEDAEIDSAPESTLVHDPGLGEGSWCMLVLFAFLACAALVVLVFRGELFTSDDEGPAQPPSSSSSSTSSRTFSTSTTVSGPSSSLLILGRMRETATQLETRVDTAYVTGITIEDHRMAVRGDSARPVSETVHLQTLPYELFPALVREARTTLGVRDPRSWRIDVTPGAGAGEGPRVRVTVTGEEGTAHLDADATARITERRPVRRTAGAG